MEKYKLCAVRMDEQLFSELAQACRELGVSKSTLLRLAVKNIVEAHKQGRLEIKLNLYREEVPAAVRPATRLAKRQAVTV